MDFQKIDPDQQPKEPLKVVQSIDDLQDLEILNGPSEAFSYFQGPSEVLIKTYLWLGEQIREIPGMQGYVDVTDRINDCHSLAATGEAGYLEVIPRRSGGFTEEELSIVLARIPELKRAADYGNELIEKGFVPHGGQFDSSHYVLPDRDMTFVDVRMLGESLRRPSETPEDFRRSNYVSDLLERRCGSLRLPFAIHASHPWNRDQSDYVSLGFVSNEWPECLEAVPKKVKDLLAEKLPELVPASSNLELAAAARLTKITEHDYIVDTWSDAWPHAPGVAQGDPATRYMHVDVSNISNATVPRPGQTESMALLGDLARVALKDFRGFQGLKAEAPAETPHVLIYCGPDGSRDFISKRSLDEFLSGCPGVSRDFSSTSLSWSLELGSADVYEFDPAAVSPLHKASQKSYATLKVVVVGPLEIVDI